MPFKFVCGGCGAQLLEVEDIAAYQKSFSYKPEPTIEALIGGMIGDKCPKCGKPLAKRPIEIRVEIAHRTRKEHAK